MQNGQLDATGRNTVGVEYTPADGYLVLADISGYTKFLVGTELDHGHAIVRELTSLVRHTLVPPLRFVKVEGDAVFCYATDATFRDGERLVELVEACYFAFTNRLDDMRRSTTCTCRACASIGSLDLKFLVHHGTFVVDLDEDGREDVAGRDVIVVHRLLKNTVGETGIESGYAFLTSPCLEHLPEALSLKTHSETYEGIGTVMGGIHDLRPVVVTMREARRERITSDEADFETGAELAAAAAVVWQYVVDPVERQRWVCTEMNDEPDATTRNSEGRIGPGATMHCNHGPGAWLREFVDWRPFDYFTCRTVMAGDGTAESRTVIETFEFESIDDRTRATARVRAVDRSDTVLSFLDDIKPWFVSKWERSWELLAEVIAEDTSALEASS